MGMEMNIPSLWGCQGAEEVASGFLLAVKWEERCQILARIFLSSWVVLEGFVKEENKSLQEYRACCIEMHAFVLPYPLAHEKW